MFSTCDIQPALPRAADPAGLWITLLARDPRAAVVAAFAADPELRVALGAMLGELGGLERSAFVGDFAKALVSLTAPVSPAGAVLPALVRCVDPVGRGASL